MKEWTPPANRILTPLCACAFAAALLLATRLAYAEALFRIGTPAEIRRALRLDHAAPPVQYLEQSEQGTRGLELGLRENPWHSAAWIDLGLEAERGGRVAEAEHDLLRAAHFDHRYAPAWTLANFYFRHGDKNSFWTWASRAAELGGAEFAESDLHPLLQLANMIESDPLAALHRLGGGEGMVNADVGYLTNQRRWDAAQQVARLVPAEGRNRARLVELTERQIRAGNAVYAVELWKRLFPRADSREALANGEFPHAPSGAGFDWRWGAGDDVTRQWQPSQVTFSFSGASSGANEESCALLEQIVPVAPGNYRLLFDFRASEMPSPSGVRWEWNGQEGASIETFRDWKTTTALVSLRSGGSGQGLVLTRLRLIYRREPGTVPARGRLELRKVSLEAIP